MWVTWPEAWAKWLLAYWFPFKLHYMRYVSHMHVMKVARGGGGTASCTSFNLISKCIYCRWHNNVKDTTAFGGCFWNPCLCCVRCDLWWGCWCLCLFTEKTIQRSFIQLPCCLCAWHGAVFVLIWTGCCSMFVNFGRWKDWAGLVDHLGRIKLIACVLIHCANHYILFVCFQV